MRLCGCPKEHDCAGQVAAASTWFEASNITQVAIEALERRCERVRGGLFCRGDGALRAQIAQKMPHRCGCGHEGRLGKELVDEALVDILGGDADEPGVPIELTDDRKDLPRPVLRKRLLL